MAADTIPHRLMAAGWSRGDGPAYAEKSGGDWKITSWRRYAEEVREITRALVGWGFQPGEVVCVLGFNRPEWVLVDVAAMTAGGAVAGIYTTCSGPEVRYIVGHSEARIVVVENEAQWKKIEGGLDELPKLEKVVLMRGASAAPHDKLLSWEDFVAKAADVADSVVDERLAGLKDEDLATLIYTSGTTGPPKGVMLSHRNLAWTAGAACRIISVSPGDVGLSYLPLSHIAEQVFTIHGPITGGVTVHFAESLEKLPDNLKEVRPTILFGVPRIWEKMHAKVSERVSGATGVKKSLLNWALGVGRAVSDHRNRSQPMSLGLRLQYKLADRLVFSKVKGAMGLDRARICVSGAAPIAPEVIDFFAALDLMIHEVYGQSEDTGPTTFNVPGATRIGTVGTTVEGTEVKIAEDGEIVVRGPHVFMGYYKEPAATAETLVDGWLQSGDLGAFDNDGFLKITGRKKEIIITAGGRTSPPRTSRPSSRTAPSSLRPW